MVCFAGLYALYIIIDLKSIMYINNRISVFVNLFVEDKMVLKSYNEVIGNHSEFKAGWNVDGSAGWQTLENPRFGKLEHVVHYNDKASEEDKRSGKVGYDQYVIIETPGTIIVPFDVHNGVYRVGMIVEPRPVPGKTYLALPRGFAEGDESALETAYRELSEETGYDGRNRDAAIALGRINPNTAFYATSPYVVALRLPHLEEKDFSSLDEKLKRDPNNQKLKKQKAALEGIKKTKPYSFDELCIHAEKASPEQGIVECGLTLAALSKFGLEFPEFYL